MKKFWLCFITILLFPICVKASSGTISVTGGSTAVVGNKVTVTVTLKGTALGSWEMDLKYDKNYLQLLSSTAEGGGTYMVNAATSALKSKSYTFTFKALKSGSTSVDVGSYLVYDFNDQSQVNITSSSKKTIKIMTQAELEESYSKDNNLKSLSVEGYDISPSFSKDVLNYSVIVPEDTTVVKVLAVANDSKSSVKGSGEIEVNLGINTIDIIVTAENGSEKTYTISLEVKDSNPISVTVLDKEYTLVKAERYLTKPEGFISKTVQIDNIQIPAFYNENCNITLIGLKDSDGKIRLFSYDEQTNTYYKYITINSFNLNLMIMDLKDEIRGYSKYTQNINEEEIQVYKFNSDSKYSLIYAKNLATGEDDYYMYDSKLESVILYNSEYSDYLLNQNQMFIYIIFALGIIVFVLIILLISLTKKKKKKAKNSKASDKKTLLTEEDKKIIEL